MFCKWCGADNPNNTRKCIRCGREVPPMSDCGGFYDLVPSARMKNATNYINCETDEMGEAAKVGSSLNKCGEKNTPTSCKSKTKIGKHIFITLIALLAIVFASVMSCTLHNKVNECMDTINQIKKDICKVSSDVSSIQKEMGIQANVEVTQPADTEDIGSAVLENQDITITIDIKKDKSGISATSRADQGNFMDNVTSTVLIENGVLSEIVINIPEINGGTETIRAIFEKTDDSCPNVEFYIDGHALGKAESNKLWEYRKNNSSDWKEIDSAEITPEIIERHPELRLTYSRTSTNGNTLKIIISGITIV